jgi:hypothetical protein
MNKDNLLTFITTTVFSLSCVAAKNKCDAQINHFRAVREDTVQVYHFSADSVEVELSIRKTTGAKAVVKIKISNTAACQSIFFAPEFRLNKDEFDSSNAIEIGTMKMDSYQGDLKMIPPKTAWYDEMITGEWPKDSTNISFDGTYFIVPSTYGNIHTYRDIPADAHWLLTSDNLNSESYIWIKNDF